MTLAEHDSDIKIKACTKNPSVILTRFCAYNLRDIRLAFTGPMVLWFKVFWRYMHVCLFICLFVIAAACSCCTIDSVQNSPEISSTAKR